MTRILLIRHGSTDLMGRVLYGRIPGVSLNTEGHQQAQRLGTGLARDFEIDALVSSPMERARETAEPVAQAQRRAMRIEESITEVDVGNWVGHSFEDLAHNPEWKNFNRRRSLCMAPGGESMMHVQARAWGCVRRYVCEGHKTAAFVTHGDVIRCLLVLMLGLSIDDIHRLEISPASVTEIVLSDWYPVLRRMNYTY